MKDEEEMKGEGERKKEEWGGGWGAREGREKEEEAGGHTLAPLFPAQLLTESGHSGTRSG